MKHISAIAVTIMSLAALMSCGGPDTEDYASYVDPKIGSGGHGHVFVGASVPFGMVQLGPTSIPNSWDWTSGYHESDSTVIGFSHTHLSGTGCGDLLDITVMPVVGDVTYARGEAGVPGSGLWSPADRTREVVRPGYYSVPLTRYDILAELTATGRVGFHRYTFPATDSAAIVLDMENGGHDRTTGSEMKAVGDNRVEGFRRSSGWANDQTVYFAAEFSKPFDSFELHGGDLYGRANFSTGKDEQILVKVGISPVSAEAARKNLEAEISAWDFDAVADAAYADWNRELSRVRITTDNDRDRRIFYSALYHSYIFPCLYSDVDSTDRYTVYSLWDTYRAEMPLLSIVQPGRYAAMINSMVDIASEQGRLPVWHLWSNETDCMVGNPGAIVVADAIVKNYPGVDRDAAYAALVKTMTDSIRGMGLRDKYGYIPSDLFVESIAYDMEYAVADAATAHAAEVMGDSTMCRFFTDRSHSYRNYFDPTVNFMRGKMADGAWRVDFDPVKSRHRADDYCEGNAWQYTWLAPHDVDGLAQCFGGKEAMVAKLDSLFIVSSEMTGDASPDISGMVGQYAHGNEPGHHIPYLYAMLGQPDKTAALVSHIIETLYTDGSGGMPGNEDAGQMSAWYIMSALGFYPVEPAVPRYWFGTPRFDHVAMEVPSGVFEIEVLRTSPDQIHIGNVRLNGKDYKLPYINHDDIMRGGKITFEMTDLSDKGIDK